MFKSNLVCTFVFTLALASSAAAEKIERVSLPQPAVPIEKALQGTDSALVRLAADWISGVFGLPHLQVLPAIERIPVGKTAFLPDASRLPDGAVMSERGASYETAAHYDQATRTIYLAAGWDGSTPAGMAVLVNALAHHFQVVGRPLHYHCAQERNALPYEAQERWLRLYETGLSQEFGVDSAALMLITQCIP